MIKAAQFILAGAFALFSLFSLSAMGVAQESTGNGGNNGEPSPLPITRVSMFTSGVGYFQHDGTVSGTEEITLTFSRKDINDVLKSLVIQDFDGGLVETVSYPSQDPLSRILNSFSLDLSDNPSLAEILGRTRGEEVIILGPAAVRGTILSIEYRDMAGENGTRKAAFINLMTAEGIEQRSIEEIRSITFTDGELQEEIDAALSVIAEHRQEDRKSVTLRFSGQGNRRVRVGYIREVPVWKTSYRIVLDENGTEDAQIQGWSIIENTGELDWRDVTLQLVSEMPVSFVMDLYSPVYTSRPVITPPAGVSAAPREYGRAMPPAAESYREPAFKSEGLGSGLAEDAADSFTLREQAEEAPGLNLSSGVESAALPGTGSVYTIATPVSISRRSAAMVPIVSGTIGTEEISIYDQSALPDRPLKGVRILNSTGLQLPAGPVTLFEGANYAGDALLPELLPDEERYASYAVDLATGIYVTSDTYPEKTVSIKITGGFLTIERMQRLETRYRINRIAADPAELIILHPKRSGWNLEPGIEPLSETGESYRFSIRIQPDDPVEFSVPLKRTTGREIALINLGEDQIGYYLSQPKLDDKTEEELQRLRELKHDLSEKEAARREIEEELSSIYRDQERIRKNIQAIDSTSNLYRRYLETLTEQEDKIEELENRLKSARSAEESARTALRDYIDSL
jgi:hypothetical protein